MANEALQDAVTKAKGQAPLAGLIGVPQSLISYWLNRSKKGVPSEYCAPIEQATGVPRHRLRPDIFPPPDDDAITAPPTHQSALS